MQNRGISTEPQHSPCELSPGKALGFSKLQLMCVEEMIQDLRKDISSVCISSSPGPGNKHLAQNP